MSLASCETAEDGREPTWLPPRIFPRVQLAPPDIPNVSIRDIQRIVCARFNISRIDLISERRTAKLAHPRFLAMYLAKKLTLRSTGRIGRLFGNRDHTTVLSAIKKTQRQLDAGDAALAEELAYLEREILS